MEKPSRTVLKVSDLKPGGGTPPPSNLGLGFARDIDALPPGFFEGTGDMMGDNESERRLLALLAELSHLARLGSVGQMFAALAHELNQPLTAINNFVGTARHLLDGTRGIAASRAREMIDNATIQTVRAGAIIHSLRAFTEKRESVRSVEDIDAIVHDAVTLAFAGAEAGDVAVKLDLADVTPPLLIDRIQIQQVLVNLICNAVDAMRGAAHRELTITTRTANRYLCISVRDTGPGLAAEVQAQLFAPFATTKKNGMGVGLAICKTIVEAHGGRIDLDPASDGGACFIIHLPLMEEVES